MKYFLILPLLILSACGQTDTHPTVVKIPIFLTHIHDVSLSTSGITYFDSSDARELYYTIAANGGGSIRFLTASNNANAQNVLAFDIPSWDTASTKKETNIYKRARLSASNKSLATKRQLEAGPVINQYICAACQPCKTKFTDLATALTLGQQTLASAPGNCRKFLLISSDMRNDPQWKRHAPLQPIKLDGVTVVLVRPALSKDQLDKIFPDASLQIFTTMHDAILFINNQTNQ